MTKSHFFKGYVTLLYFDFWPGFIYLLISFISSQYRYICEKNYIFHNGSNTGYTLYILLIVFNHFVKIVHFFTTSQKTRLANFFKNFFIWIFSIFMRFFALFKKIIQKKLKKGVDDCYRWCILVIVKRQQPLDKTQIHTN